VNAPPGKEKGALLAAPIPKLTRLAQDNSGQKLAQTCRHDATCVEQMPPGRTHHAAEICAVCGRFIRWLPKPETLHARRLNAFRLARLAMHEGLTSWEREFLASISHQTRLSPKQQALVARLVRHYLEGKPS
jgi:hypothetical protein